MHTSKRESVRTHMQILHTWATFFLERNIEFGTKEMQRLAEWTQEALDYLEEENS